MSTLPQTNSVAELARFWNTHDLTEFEDELEAVGGAVFDRGGQAIMRLRLQSAQAAAVHRIAMSKGVKDTDLLQEWVSEKLRAS